MPMQISPDSKPYPPKFVELLSLPTNPIKKELIIYVTDTTIRVVRSKMDTRAWPHGWKETFERFAIYAVNRPALTMPVFLTALVYIERLLPLKHFPLSDKPHPLESTFLGVLMLANKNIEDESYSNKSWVIVSGFDQTTVNKIEKYLLAALAWDVSFPEDEILAHYDRVMNLYPELRSRSYASSGPAFPPPSRDRMGSAGHTHSRDDRGQGQGQTTSSYRPPDAAHRYFARPRSPPSLVTPSPTSSSSSLPPSPATPSPTSSSSSLSPSPVIHSAQYNSANTRHIYRYEPAYPQRPTQPSVYTSYHPPPAQYNSATARPDHSQQPTWPTQPSRVPTNSYPAPGSYAAPGPSFVAPPPVFSNPPVDNRQNPQRHGDHHAHPVYPAQPTVVLVSSVPPPHAYSQQPDHTQPYNGRPGPGSQRQYTYQR